MAVAGAVVTFAHTEAPAPLPVITVDLVQEDAGQYTRAFAKTLPVIEAKVAPAPDRAKRPASAAAISPRPPDSHLRQARRDVSDDVRPAAPEKPLHAVAAQASAQAARPPQNLLRSAAPQTRTRTPAAQPVLAPSARSDRTRGDTFPDTPVVASACTNTGRACFLPSPKRSSGFAQAGEAQPLGVSRYEVVDSVPRTYLEDAPGAVSKEASAARVEVGDLTPVQSLLPSMAPSRAEAPPPQSIAAVETAALKKVPPPRSKPEPPRTARLIPATEVARALETLKRAPGEPRQSTPGAVPVAARATGNRVDTADVPPAFEGDELGNRPPQYPYAARLRGIEGEVLLRVVVFPSGRTADVSVRSSSGSPLLDRAARVAVRTWRFRPARRSGQSVVGWVDVPVTFRLTD